MTRLCKPLFGGFLGVLALTGVLLADLHPKVREAEAKRVAVIEKVKPAVVAIFGPGGNGGGSGVLISDDGYALTNFHVTAGSGNVMKCGLPDGILYDAVLVGLDKVGDVALIKLLPKKATDKFPFAPLGDSDKTRAGDWSLAMGNPFLLATDFTPTVTFGLVSGVHRYQYPSGTFLEYTDCIQIETSINPGNSGGPLFNMDGELIGINGRGSFDKRHRINSGVGYAISINQIKNFLGHLRAGLDSDHASLGAQIESEPDDGSSPRMLVRSIIDCDANRRGIEPGDQLVSFAGRPMSSVNQYKNALGIYPRGWRVPVVFRRDNEKKEVLVRLMGVQKQALEDPNKPGQPGQPGQPPRPAPVTPASKFFEAKPGFANHYFNKEEKNRLWKDFLKHGDFTKSTGEFIIKADGEADQRLTKLDLNIKEAGATVTVKLNLFGIDYDLEPLKADIAARDQKAPTKSGGLISAFYLLRQLMVVGEKGFIGEFTHGGQEPWYLLPTPGEKADYKKLRVMCEVLRTKHAGMSAKWYFSLKDQTLVGGEVIIDRDEDPCELYFLDYKKVGDKNLPTRIQVRHGEYNYADFKKVEYQFNAGK